ncbi:bifunctional 3-dehydroquinate dehydratase/shikimate dehydrogenase, chloroplastic-like isoform X2 [Carya illinoinensis]|uniref:bifunctional 3-dehydroquinate dehydratase/shikimate dehydrogenase, chloroplastic-like isoform X2 n=1 Tax=Carya illinoinensis TaxID=32201 RepID=UPI001C719F73|nr:bifunctional 3-dehydroquinate dehydratase/shikimate dehydrogenase, chloroplastic-like isoform X2 [Carya illinoinensis]
MSYKGKTLLFDCGIHLAYSGVAALPYFDEIDPSTIDVLLITHCTIPQKEAALKCCDEVDTVAKSIGAVNCIIRRSTDGKLIGHNTDYVGAISAIEDGLRGIYHVV